MKVRTTIYIDESVMREFQKYCVDAGTNVSARVEELIRQQIKARDSLSACVEEKVAKKLKSEVNKVYNKLMK